MTKRFRSLLLLTAALALLCAGGVQAAGTAVQLDIKGPIGPATSDYVLKGLEHARETGAQLVIIRLDTPGGLDSAMREMIQGILNSPIPVATFVAPSGARAASAGTYMLYASHISAMSPATNLGAATPVAIGGGGSEPSPPANPFGQPTDPTNADESAEEPTEPTETMPADSGSAMERKSVNDAVAYIRGLAEVHGRNGDWAEEAVRKASSLNATEALELNVIDLIAESVPALLRAIDGRTVKVLDESITLETADLEIETFAPDWRNQFLATITNPNIAYLLMLVGIYGLLLEGYNPGTLLPGIVGAICLLLALYAFQVLPVNYTGLALIILGVVLIIAESLVPSFGVLGFGGIAAFVFGSIILLDTDVPGLEIARTLIGGIALVASLALMALIYLLMKLRMRPAVSGAESMLGELAEVLEDFDRDGVVFLNGERWNAQTDAPVQKGDRVRVKKVHGLVVDVTPVTTE